MLNKMMILSFSFSLFFILIYISFNKYIFDKFFNLSFFAYIKENFSYTQSLNLYILTQFFFGLLILYTLSNLLFILNFNIDILTVILVVLLSIYILLNYKKAYNFNFKSQKNSAIFKNIKNIFLIQNFKYYKFLIFLIFIILLNRIFLDWNDEDEIKIYGYMTRLFAEGWIFNDGIFEPFTRYGEISNSLFYKLTNNFFLIRFLRLLQFLGVLYLFYFLIKLLTKSTKIAFIAAILFSLSPELSYVGYFSLKTDFQLFIYEILSLIFLFIWIKINFDKNQKINIRNSKEINFFLLSISTIFSAVAFATRLSGIYIFILCSLILFGYILKNFKYFKKKLINICLIVALLGVICLPHLIRNFLEFDNPLYPLNGFWNLLFDNPKFDEFWSLKNAKLNYNININFPIINEIYILVYNSLPFSKNIFKDYHYLFYRPLDSASSGWLTPVMLIIFLVPFYFKKIKIIKYLFIIFIFLFIFWSNGIQFVRVFIAGSSVSIILLALILSYESENRRWIYLFYKNITEVLILLLIIYHSLVSFKSNFMGVDALINEEKRYFSNLAKSQPRYKWDLIYNYKNIFFSPNIENLENNLKYIEKNYFSRKDVIEINNKIDLLDRKVLIRHNLNDLPYLETVIKKGYIIRSNENSYKVKKILASNTIFLNCLFGTNITPKKNDELIFDNKKVKLVCSTLEKNQ
tara:strand:+ start:27711 stop:29780 length:2070 start_codon:yes stop_codon:yes gene_type:complete